MLLDLFQLRVSDFQLWGLTKDSGFHGDSGYEGKLIFSVYSAESQPMQLYRGSWHFSICSIRILILQPKATYSGQQQA